MCVSGVLDSLVQMCHLYKPVIFICALSGRRTERKSICSALMSDRRGSRVQEFVDKKEHLNKSACQWRKAE